MTAFALLFAGVRAVAQISGPLDSAAALAAFLDGESPGSRAFVVSGLVTTSLRDAFIVDGGDARIYMTSHLPSPPPRGASVRVIGSAFVPQTDTSIPFMLRPEPLANAREITIGAVGDPPAPLHIALGGIDPARHHLALLETSGEVLDAGRDEFDAHYAILILGEDGATLPVSIECDKVPDLRALVGAEVAVAGLFWKSHSGVRKFSGPLLVADGPDALRVIAPPADPFAAPRLENLRYVSPADVAHMGRRTIGGRVLATWGRNRFMLQSDDKRIMQVELAHEEALPRCGASVTVAGLPRADILQIRMTRAVYRERPAEPDGADMPHVPLAAILNRSGGALAYEAARNGSIVSFAGRIIGRQHVDGHILVDADETAVTVDASTHSEVLDALEPGSLVRVTGMCLLEGPAWSTENVFPRIEDFRVVVRGADDIRILAHPPWWTPRRFICAIALLLAIIVAILVWNRALNRLVVRRGRALLREQIGREREALRVDERTRLAVELHDSLSQCLGGLACQVAATRSLIERDPQQAGECLGAAERMLQSSRTELQRCLFDLRGTALGEADFAKALRQTLAPIAGSTIVDVRFAVARARLSDTLAHAVICAVRELVSNAIRHGRATHVEVRGEEKDGRVAFSVRDDGCGFDAARRPGPTEGHFGLEGIRERTRRLGGSLQIDSSPGRGTAISVEFALDDPNGKAGTADA